MSTANSTPRRVSAPVLGGDPVVALGLLARVVRLDPGLHLLQLLAIGDGVDEPRIGEFLRRVFVGAVACDEGAVLEEFEVALVPVLDGLEIHLPTEREQGVAVVVGEIRLA